MYVLYIYIYERLLSSYIIFAERNHTSWPPPVTATTAAVAHICCVTILLLVVVLPPLWLTATTHRRCLSRFVCRLASATTAVTDCYAPQVQQQQLLTSRSRSIILSYSLCCLLRCVVLPGPYVLFLVYWIPIYRLSLNRRYASVRGVGCGSVCRWAVYGWRCTAVVCVLGFTIYSFLLRFFLRARPPALPSPFYSDAASFLSVCIISMHAARMSAHTHTPTQTRADSSIQQYTSYVIYMYVVSHSECCSYKRGVEGASETEKGNNQPFTFSSSSRGGGGVEEYELILFDDDDRYNICTSSSSCGSKGLVWLSSMSWYDTIR